MTKVEMIINDWPAYPAQDKGENARVYFKRVDDWAFDAGRKTRFNGNRYTADEAVEALAFLLDARCPGDDEVRTNLSVSFERGRCFGEVPPDCLKIVRSAADWFRRNGGPIPAPSICRVAGPKGEDMWLMMMILGASGRQFEFARTAIAEVLGYKSGESVDRFVKLLLKLNWLQLVRKGHRYESRGDKMVGLSDLFELTRWKERWGLDLLAPNRDDLNLKWWKSSWRKYLVETFEFLHMKNLLERNREHRRLGAAAELVPSASVPSLPS